MSDTPHLKIARNVALVALAAWGTLCLAQNELCNSSEFSHIQESECLSKEFRSIDDLLKQKVVQLIKIAEPVDMLNAPPARVEEKRKQIRNAIRRADILWRQSLEVECDTLITASFGMGNGYDKASLRCRINRARERIKALSLSEPYQWLWEK